MNRDSIPEVDRRKWLTSCARTMVLGGLAVTAGVLAARGQICSCPDESLACASCSHVLRCSLSRAAAVRAPRTEQGNR